jgi:hypothetical protein
MRFSLRGRPVVTGTRFLRFSLLLVFICVASLPPAFCQDDEFVEQGRSILKGMDFTPEMVSALQEKAGKGDAKTQYVLGWLYFIGQSVEKNDELAVQWMTNG